MPRYNSANSGSGSTRERPPARPDQQADVRQNDARRRRKVALACEACRVRKIKCDGVIPVCGTCRRRQTPPERCLYHNDNARTALSKEYVNGLHDQIRRLERACHDAGHAQTSSFSEFQTLQSLESIDGDPPRQLNAYEIQEGQHQSVLTAPLHEVHTPRQNRSGDQEPPQDQFSLSQEQYLPGDHAYLDMAARPLQRHPPIVSNTAGSTYFTSQSDPGQDGIRLERDQQMERLSVSNGSQDVNVRQDSTEPESPINAMGTVSAITNGGLDSSDHFYGTSSVVSFSQQIYQTQQHLSGRDGLNFNQASATAAARPSQGILSELLTSMPVTKPDDYFLPPRALADHLLNCYWNRVHCLYPFVHQQSFISRYNRLWSPDTQGGPQNSVSRIGLGGSGCPASVFFCALNSIFALGCQFSDLQLAQREALSETFFQRSKQLLRIDILDEGSLALIQTLLIVAQYLQSTQFPNRCWNVVGLACRMAQGLGLHLDGVNENRSFLEVEMMRRTWYGCVTLDLVLSMTLGRPMYLSDAWPVPLPRAIDDNYMDSTSLICQQPSDVFSRTSFFICTIKLYNILGHILTNVYNLYPASGGSKGTTDQTESSPLDTLVKMDCELSNFESDIPPQLHWGQRQEYEMNLVSERQANVLHARFLHLKIVLYRPIFTQLCRKTFPGSLPGSVRNPPTEHKYREQQDNHLYTSFSHQCSITCVKAAQELIELISITSQTDATGAWWYNIFYLFTSAMVIILAELCPVLLTNILPETLNASWQRCQHALELMGSHNAAAQKYRDTLNAIRQKAAPSISNEPESQTSPSEPLASPMETYSTLPEETGGASYQREQTRSGARSPTKGNININVQPHGSQLWDVLWQDTGSIPTWNIEEWGETMLA